MKIERVFVKVERVSTKIERVIVKVGWVSAEIERVFLRVERVQEKIERVHGSEFTQRLNVLISSQYLFHNFRNDYLRQLKSRKS